MLNVSMTKLNTLRVSLTKHGAHKVATLLLHFDKDLVLSKVSDGALGININEVQARKILSAGADNSVPEVWNKVRLLGKPYIDSLVFVAIVFSHIELIKVMQQATKRPYKGTIQRSDCPDGKSFTNFACVVEELGFSTDHSVGHVSYDLSHLFDLPGFGPLVKDVLGRKLKSAGWSGLNTVEDECIHHRFHEVFGISDKEFSDWLSSSSEDDLLEDHDFFTGGDGAISGGIFKFIAGHNSKKTGSVVVKAGKPKRANLLHNNIQNEFYKRLCAEFGPENVGTEVPTGEGTSIDIVVQIEGACTFYEIKTAETLKGCIRQAIPQLLEYAYWGGAGARADRLVIVSTHPITPEAESYISFLRATFTLPLEYQQFSLASM